MNDARLASISVDFESIYYYAETLGLDPEDRDRDYERIVERFLQFFADAGVKATFFLVGRDIRGDKLPPVVVRRIAAAGHEIGNHTVTHPHNFASLPREEKRQEIVGNQSLIEEITGERVVGFRAPCFDVDEEIVDILVDEGYWYDSSVYPCSLKTVQEIGYYLLCRGKFRNTGSWKYSFAPGDPYSPDSRLHRRGGKNILEIPIATTPFLRLPFYSTVLFTFGTGLFDASYALVRRRPAFTYELHSIDLADYEADGLRESYPGIRRHPSMRLSLKTKLAMLTHALGRFRGDFEMVTMREMAGRLKRQ